MSKQQAAAARLSPLALACALVFISTVLPVSTAHAQVASNAMLDVDLPRQPLDVSLHALARQSGRAIAVNSQLVAGKTGAALRGRYSLTGALGQLLTGSGLAASEQEGTIVLRATGNDDVTSLNEVRVVAQADGAAALPSVYAGGQMARGGSLGLLGTTNVMDTPFSTTNYTAALLEDQQARTIADVVINDASVRTTTASNAADETYQIRGLTVAATDVGMNGLYGLISASRVPAQILERVEILKGPGSLMNGISLGGSVGGGINVVTKRAGDEPLTRLSTVYTGQSNVALQADISRRFGDNHEWGVRFNRVTRNGEGSVDGGNVKGGLGALGLDYRGARLRWSLDAIAQQDDTDGARPQISLLSTTAITAIPAPPDARSNFYPGTTLSQKDNTIATRLEYDLTDALTLYAAIGYRENKAYQIFPVSTVGVNALGNFTVRGTYYDSYTNTTSANAGLSWRFNTGSVAHTLTAAATGLKQGMGYAYIFGPTTPSNIYNAVPLPTITAARTVAGKSSDTDLHSFALADTLSFANGRVLLTLGARDQTVEVLGYNLSTGAQNSSYKASAVSPLAGVVFKPVANVSLYGNYTEGLSKGAVVGAGYANTGATLAPYKSKQYEAGVKVDLGRLTTTAAVYQIARPAAQADSANNYGYFGEQRNRGLELSAYGELQPGLRGMASVAFVDPKLTKTSGGQYQGNTAAGVPKKTASASLEWDTPWVKGLSLSGRVIYTSGAYLNAANTARFDSWTRFDIGASYRTAVAGKAVVLRANLENAFDKNYWLTTGNYVTVGSPRTLVVSASVDF